MTQPTSNSFDERGQQILDAAAERIIQFGYDKTSMSDIADQAHVTRAIVYLHFKSKERLFEALLVRETQKYLQTWLADFEAAPHSGTIASVFRSTLVAVNRSPLMTAMMKQDRHVFGKYLRKPGGIYSPVQSEAVWPELLKALQKAGAVREEIQPGVFGHLMNAFVIGIIEMEARRADSDGPAFDAMLEALVDMLDRTLTPQDGGNLAAGKAIIQGFAQQARFLLEQGQPAAVENQKS